MSVQRYRMDEGGLIDRDKPFSFSFNGKILLGYEGDTLASALLANGQRTVARSFKYHRPRGIYSSGSEEPNALLQVGLGESWEPNARASQVLLEEGMALTSQNHWPSLRFDMLSVNSLLSPIMSTGFYNKTFKWPRRFWPVYEAVLRNVSGLGRVAKSAGSDRYEQVQSHCDILIVGAGPAGLAAAITLARTGASIMLVDEAGRIGGWLLRERATLGDESGQQWAARLRNDLASRGNVRLLEQTTAFGYYDHNLVALSERLCSKRQTDQPAERLWRVRARQVILATGSIERPLVFANNDLPGIMLAGAARAYLNQFAVRSGERAVVYTNNDSAYRSAADLYDAGVRVAALVDTRKTITTACTEILKKRNIPLFENATLTASSGSRLRSVEVVCQGSADRTKLDCDLLCVSGGWTPTLHLHAQSGGTSRFDADLDVFVPGTAKQRSLVAGSVRGLHRLSDCLDDGLRAAIDVADRLGLSVETAKPWSDASMDGDDSPGEYQPQTRTGSGGFRSNKGKQFVDLQNDVTAKDVVQAHRENYVSVEHLKRYTTLGMGTDQGKTSNLNGLKMLARLRDEPVPQVGTTTFRPPYTPVTLALLAGRSCDRYLAPTRKTVMHAGHEAMGAKFDFNGLWLRPQCYVRAGESVDTAIRREALAVRERAGLADISTLGKFEIQGRDCAEFLDRVYVKNLSGLAVGRARQGPMLRDDGMVLDDGTVTRLEESHYFITVSTGHTEHVLQHFEFLLDVAWPDLDVNLLSVTEQWAGVALAGPESREVLQPLVCDSSHSLSDLPYMGYTNAELRGRDSVIPARIIRISYSGELAHEVYVPSRAGAELWEILLEQGGQSGLTPYGMDAMDVLRIEKGFIAVGAEADGRITPGDLGFERMVSKTKRFVGWHALKRPALNEQGRLQVVGLRPLSDRDRLREGSELIANPGDRGHDASIGHVSSAGYSPTFDRSVALALVRDGRHRLGETIYSVDAARGKERPVAVEIVATCSYDLNGERMRA